LLLCRHGGKKGRQVGIPLSLVARLEEFCVSDIERSGAREVVQYRGEIMPLIRLSHALGSVGEEEHRDSIQVVVYREHGRSVGLVVEQIADIVEERLIVKDESSGSHFMATAVVQGRVTDILDVRAVIESAKPDYLTQCAAS
jgi:two-component system chemotaxis sensor kinase CheA